MHRLIRLLAAAVVIAASTAAIGDEQVDRARALFSRGGELFVAEDYESALAAFKESFRLNPARAALYNMAMCERALFRHAESRQTFQRFLAAWGADLPAERRQEIQRMIVELEALLGEVRLTVVPRDAQVFLDEAPLPSDRWGSTLLRTGRHTLRAEAPGYEPMVQQLDISIGEPTEVDLELRALAGLGEAEGVAPARRGRKVLRSWWLWTAVGLVVVGGAAAGVALAVTNSPPTLGEGDWVINAP